MQIHTALNLANANALFGLLAKVVAREAETQNGWDMERHFRAPITEGTVPHGVILFSHAARFDGGNTYGTAEFNVTEAGDISFVSGHYDLAFGDAVVDYHGRCAGMIPPEILNS